MLGFVVSDEDKARSICAASRRPAITVSSSSAPEPTCERVGMRVFTEEDLEKAKVISQGARLPAKWVENPYQGTTLHVTDPSARRSSSAPA